MSGTRRLVAGVVAGLAVGGGVVGMLAYRHIPRVHLSTAPETEQESLRNLVRGFEVMARAHAVALADRGPPRAMPAPTPAAPEPPPEAPSVDWEALGDRMTRELAASASLSSEEQLRVRHVLISVGRARAVLEQNLAPDRLVEQEASLIRVAETQLKFVVPHDKEDAVTGYFKQQQAGAAR